jgi:hypothetical protein
MISVRSFVIAFTGRQLHAYRRILRSVESDSTAPVYFCAIPPRASNRTPATSTDFTKRYPLNRRAFYRVLAKRKGFFGKSIGKKANNANSAIGNRLTRLSAQTLNWNSA